MEILSTLPGDCTMTHVFSLAWPVQQAVGGRLGLGCMSVDALMLQPPLPSLPFLPPTLKYSTSVPSSQGQMFCSWSGKRAVFKRCWTYSSSSSGTDTVKGLILVMMIDL